MGIPGLWAELAPAAQSTTLPSYCLTAFTENLNELRGLRLGIDASLWLFHAQQSTGGANPYLRLLFYRLAKLLTLPVLPLFVFDGPSRPTWKRGKQIKGRQHAIEQPFTQLIEAFGYQWHRAHGEAEAELAYLNQAGLVDAVLTDDSDALLFGAQVLIRNWGKNLSGTRALSRTTSANSEVFDDVPGTSAAASRLQLSGSDRDHLITLYRAQDLATLPSLGIDRDGLILVALMSGGDYDTTGLMQCGVKIALALARGGFGSSLIQAFKTSYPDQASAARSCATFASFLTTWLEEVREELRTNERGWLPSRRPKLAASLESSFLSTEESRKVLAYYVYPLTSQGKEEGAGVVQAKSAEPDLTRLARLSQIYFHWSKDAILSKFRTLLGPGVVTRRLRQEILEHNDGAGEGPWAALVESPASKAVRRYVLGLDSSGSTSTSGAASKAAAVAKTQKQQRPLHESPNATRITDFFARAALTPTAAPSTSPTRTTLKPPVPAVEPSVEVLAIKMQRRHAALAPFVDYRVLVSMDEFSRLADLGIDPTLDAELAAARTADESDHTEVDDADDDDQARQNQRGSGSKRIAPGEPLLMWLAEPLLQLSVSGASRLQAFVDEVERKADAARAKSAKKATRSGARAAAGQRTLNSFVRPLAKASLVTTKTTTTTATTSKPANTLAAGAPALPSVPRTPRQLRVPSGMRRTESVPVPALVPASDSAPAPGDGGTISTSRGWERTASLPTTVDAHGGEAEEDELDSSVEFLGAFSRAAAASGRTSAVHDRPQRTPSPSDSPNASAAERPPKSPKKSFRTAASSSRPQQPKPRLSTITISSDSSDDSS